MVAQINKEQEVCSRYGFGAAQKWYDHRIGKTPGHEKVQIFWDFKLQIDEVIENLKPDIVLMLREKPEFTMKDVTCPHDPK